MENQRKGGSAINRDVGLGPAPLFLFWGGSGIVVISRRSAKTSDDPPEMCVTPKQRPPKEDQTIATN